MLLAETGGYPTLVPYSGQNWEPCIGFMCPWSSRSSLWNSSAALAVDDPGQNGTSGEVLGEESSRGFWWYWPLWAIGLGLRFPS